MILAVKNSIDTNRQFPSLNIEQNLDWRSQYFQSRVSSKILVIIDSKVTDPRILAAGVISGAKVKILDSRRDGIAQITKILRETPPVHSLHIVAHGSPGCLYLGNSQLSLDTLADYNATIKTWSLPSILLYGCNVAQGDVGATFLSKLQQLTKAQIQASKTKVGNFNQGRNWKLDIAVGESVAFTNNEIAFNQATQNSYQGSFSNNDPFSAEFNLSDLDGTNGFVLATVGGNTGPGNVSNAGDVNGDGIDDLIIGVFRGNPRIARGTSYLVFGGSNIGNSGNIELSGLDGNNGFILNGIAPGDSFGILVSNAGDINNDGIDDLIIGAGGGTIRPSYVVFGDNQIGSSGSLDVSDLDGSNGFVLNGLNTSISNAGDINNDGIDDLTVSSFQNNEVYVVFGNNHVGSAGSLELSELDGSNGFVLNGFEELSVDAQNISVSNAGDINNDGIDDLIGSFVVFENDLTVRKNYVLFGANHVGSSGNLAISDLDGSNGFFLNGGGRSVSNAGDINNDGIDDLIIGGGITGSGPGDFRSEAYVIFGRNHIGSSGNIELATLDGNNGFVLNSINNIVSGLPVSNAGDVNNDGIDDLIIGEPGAGRDSENSILGESYVIFGGNNVGSSGSIELAMLDGSNGFIINATNDIFNERLGSSVSNAGDVNADGIDDIILGTGGLFSENAYVVFGRNSNPNIRIEAEDYVDYHDRSSGNIGGAYRNDDVDIELSQDLDDGFSVGWIQQGEWLTYDIDVPEDGFYQVVGRVASDLERDHRLDISLDGQTTELKFGDTGGWYSWENVAGGGLNLTAGHHSLRLDAGSSGFNVNYVDLVPTNNIRVEAEDYVNYHDRSSGNIGGAYRNDDVDIELSQDFDNGFSVGWIQQGEWLTYDIDVPEDGVYQVVGRVASDLDRAHRLDVSLDGQTTQLSFGDTGGWYSWEDVAGDGLHLSAGNHSLRLDVGSSGFNVNYIDLISDS